MLTVGLLPDRPGAGTGDTRTANNAAWAFLARFPTPGPWA